MISREDNSQEISKEYSLAVKSAMNILSYADNTAKMLYKKLRQKGHSDEASKFAVENMILTGVLNEKKMMESFIITLTERKMYGLSRVKLELNQKGFSPKFINEYDFYSIDFDEICYKLFIKKGGVDDNKTRALLVRYGHTYSNINNAIKRFASENS